MKKNALAAMVVTLIFTVLSGCPARPEAEAPKSMQKPLVVFLVRHAEKTDALKDPGLSEAGKVRAGDLEKSLLRANIEHVHSSDFVRTRETAAPIAKAAGVEVEIYDPKDLTALARELREKGGRHLVVGHSNTTPELTKLLGGEAGTEIDEKSEYDRLYIVTIGKDGTTISAMLRYGKAYEKTDGKTALENN